MVKAIKDLAIGDIFAVNAAHPKAEIEDVILSKVAPNQRIFRLRCFDGSPYFFSNYHNDTLVVTWTFEEVLATV